MKAFVHFLYLAEFVFEREMFRKKSRENQNTHFMFTNFFFFKTRVVYEIMWKNVVGPNRPQ